MASSPAYTYLIKEITKFVDGDTVDVIIDLGFHISLKKELDYMESMLQSQEREI